LPPWIVPRPDSDRPVVRPIEMFAAQAPRVLRTFSGLDTNKAATNLRNARRAGEHREDERTGGRGELANTRVRGMRNACHARSQTARSRGKECQQRPFSSGVAARMRLTCASPMSLDGGGALRLTPVSGDSAIGGVDGDAGT